MTPLWFEPGTCGISDLDEKALPLNRRGTTVSSRGIWVEVYDATVT
jgi:hypothetical protein